MAKNTEPILRRTVTARDKAIVVLVIICSVIVALLSHWFITAPEPAGIKLAMVGLAIGEMVSIAGIAIGVLLLVHHFSEKMTLGKWFLLLIVDIAIIVVSIICLFAFDGLYSMYQP